MSATISNVTSSCGISATINSGMAPVTSRSDIKPSQQIQPSIGSAAGNVNKVYSGSYSLNNSSATIDLTSAADPLGDAQSFTQVMSLLVTSDPTSAADVQPLGGSNGVITSATNPISGGGALHMIKGGTNFWTVDSTHKIVQVQSAGIATGNITVIGQ